MHKRIKEEIAKVVQKHLPAVQRKSYSSAKDKSYLQSIYAEEACKQSDLEWAFLRIEFKQKIISYTHKEILSSFRKRNQNVSTLTLEVLPLNGREGFLDDTKITASERKKEAQVQSGETNHNPTTLHKQDYERNKARIEGTK
ncbi:hypothetical protein [Variovorax sp. W2I14]|uniref:hypothetical protein n=1 Tax=Variovorax sp. W2I14 TaxID=3042290 RepID=UPI003D198CEF